MSPYLKIGLPAAVLSSLLTMASFQLGFLHGVAARPETAVDGRSAGDRPADLPSTTAEAPADTRPSGVDCYCPGGLYWSDESKACGQARPAKYCAAAESSEPTRGCDGRVYGHPCLVILSGMKLMSKASAEELAAQQEIDRKNAPAPAHVTKAAP